MGLFTFGVQVTALNLIGLVLNSAGVGWCVALLIVQQRRQWRESRLPQSWLTVFAPPVLWSHE